MHALAANAMRKQTERKMGSDCMSKKIGSRAALGNGFAAQLFLG
jgi:hypothetical protein